MLSDVVDVEGIEVEGVGVDSCFGSGMLGVDWDLSRTPRLRCQNCERAGGSFGYQCLQTCVVPYIPVHSAPAPSPDARDGTS